MGSSSSVADPLPLSPVVKLKKSVAAPDASVPWFLMVTVRLPEASKRQKLPDEPATGNKSGPGGGVGVLVGDTFDPGGAFVALAPQPIKAVAMSRLHSDAIKTG